MVTFVVIYIAYRLIKININSVIVLVEEEVFNNVIYEHQGIIWKVCRTFFRNEEDQKDLFQDILYKLWKARDSFRGQSKISTWVYRVSINQAIDKSRKAKSSRTILIEPEEIKDESSQRTQSKFDIEALYMAIDQLKPLEKALIMLYLNQESYKQISEVMGISEKNVSVKLVRIKERLKKFYQKISSYDE